MQSKLFFLVLPLVGAAMALPVDNEPANNEAAQIGEAYSDADPAKGAAFKAEDLAADDAEEHEKRTVVKVEATKKPTPTSTLVKKPTPSPKKPSPTPVKKPTAAPEPTASSKPKGGLGSACTIM